VLELRRDMEATRARLSGLIGEAVREDGADVVIFGCMALFGVAATLDAPVPVIDPALSALMMAESLVTMGLTHMPVR
jgi:allantoin racemase